MNSNQSPLPGRASQRGFLCKCCVAPSWRPALKRAVKRREKREWRKDAGL